MKIQKKYYLTRLGVNYEIDKDDKILEKWIPKKRADENILTMKVFPKDIHISSNNPVPKSKFCKVTKRGAIKKLTITSTKRLRFLLRNVADTMEYEVGLTYPKEFPKDGLVVKQHFHKLRMRLNYRGYKHIWVLEFQKRGAPHFHLLINKYISEEELAKMWFTIVSSGDIKHLSRGVHVGFIRSKDKMASYFITYITKQDQKQVPQEYKNVGRFWGASQNLLPCTIKKFYGNMEDIRELKKQLRPMRRWFDGKKRSWSKQRPFKSKKFVNKYIRRGVAFKVINTNLFIDEFKRRGIETSLYEG